MPGPVNQVGHGRGCLHRLGWPTTLVRMPLTDRWRTEPGSKEAGIRERFELSTTRYYEILAELVDAPDAYEHAPLVVKRLQHQRDRRRRGRYEARQAGEWRSR